MKPTKYSTYSDDELLRLMGLDDDDIELLREIATRVLAIVEDNGSKIKDARKEGYDDGYDDGYNIGRRDGYEDRDEE